MAVTLFMFPGAAFVDSNGDPLNAGTINFYKVGTTTAKDTYPTEDDAQAKTNANANPVVLDSSGRAQIWLDGQYKAVVKTSGGTTIQTVDEYPGDPGLTDTNTLPLNYIAGLKISNNATDANKDIDLAIGECRDSGDSTDMALTAALTKQSDATWAVGTGAGGMESGTTIAASTGYAVWLIERTDTGVVDALFSASFTSPTMPLNYDKKRLIGAVTTNSSTNIIGFTQTGDFFRYNDPIADIVDTTIANATFETATLSCPPDCIAEVGAQYVNDTTTEVTIFLVLRPVGSTDGATGGALQWAHIDMDTAVLDRMGGHGLIPVNSSSQIEYAAREISGSTQVNISTKGFLMSTRRDP